MLGLIAALTAVALGFAHAALGADDHAQSHGSAKTPPPPFVASTGKSFTQLMGDAMTVMDYGMSTAPMDGNPQHDFITMMIPHHQGAIDMAKALLLYTPDPELTNLAQGIITEQQNEIRLMQAWLKRYQERQAATTRHPQ
jgi:uncharacterized protein (DUF305 family)